MAGHSLSDLLHRASHRVPGVPAHSERPSGHHGKTRHDAARTHHGRNHQPARQPRVLVSWQSRIAALFGQEPR